MKIQFFNGKIWGALAATSILITPLVLSCAAEVTKNGQQTKTTDSNPGGGGTGDNGTGGNGGTGNDNGDGEGPPPDPKLAEAAAKVFFTDKILPVFNSKCSTCHTEPRFNPPTPGPLSIFSFDSMFAMLKDSPASSVDNKMINKIRSVSTSTHGGADQCPAGFNDVVCKLVVDFYYEAYPDQKTAGSGIIGEIISLSTEGKLRGWAANVDDLAAQLDVKFYVEHNGGSKTLIDTGKANIAGSDGNNDGDHAFLYTIPNTYQDGKPGKIYAYSVVGGKETALTGSPFSYTLYAPTQAGMDYYNNTLKPLLTSGCGGCHSIDYIVQRAALASPTPVGGGTATNNQLINKSAGQSHGGGNRCGGGKGSSPCSQIQTWWGLEFN